MGGVVLECEMFFVKMGVIETRDCTYCEQEEGDKV